MEMMNSDMQRPIIEFLDSVYFAIAGLIKVMRPSASSRYTISGIVLMMELRFLSLDLSRERVFSA